MPRYKQHKKKNRYSVAIGVRSQLLLILTAKVALSDTYYAEYNPVLHGDLLFHSTECGRVTD